MEVTVLSLGAVSTHRNPPPPVILPVSLSGITSSCYAHYLNPQQQVQDSNFCWQTCRYEERVAGGRLVKVLGS